MATDDDSGARGGAKAKPASRLEGVVRQWLANVPKAARERGTWLATQYRIRLDGLKDELGVGANFGACLARLVVRRQGAAPAVVAQGSCHEARAGKKCPHEVALALALVDDLGRDEHAPAVLALRREVGDETPEEALQTLVGRLAPLAKPERARPVWIVTLDGAPSVAASQTARLKNGGFGVPRRVATNELGALLADSPHPQDRAIWRHLAGASKYVRDGFENPLDDGVTSPVWLLSMLAGHPDVRLGDEGPGLDVRSGEVGIAVVETEETVEVRATIGGEVPAGGRSITRDEGLLVVDLEHRVVHVALWNERTFEALGPLFSRPLVLPRALGPLLADRLAAFEELVPLALPETLAGREVPADARLRLVFQPPGAGHVELQLRVRPVDGGPSFVPGAGDAKVTAVVGGERRFTRRDLDVERTRAWALADELGLPTLAHGSAQVEPGDAMLDLLARLEARRESELVVEWAAGATPLSVHAVTTKTVRVALKSRQDWFDLDGEVETEAGALSLGLLLRAQREGRRYVELSRGRYALVAKLVDRRLARLAALTHASEGRLELSRAALADPEGAFVDVDLVVPPAWTALALRAQKARHHVAKVPAALDATLRDYQLEGFRWLSRLAMLGLGGCLADDMGLGKTLQALAVMVERAPKGPQLVVAPTSVGFNWHREAARFAPSLSRHDLRSTNRASLLARLGPGDVVVTSYGLMRQEIDRLAAVRFSTVVLDEAHAVKNWDTETAKCARRLDAEWKLALTGTPVENHLGELYSLVQTVAPGVFGPWEQFSRAFATPIEKQKNVDKREALASLVRPIILRRTKGEVLKELPSRTEVRVDVVLTKAERGLYEAARVEAVNAIQQASGERGRLQVFAALTRLRQLACDTRLVFPDVGSPSSKLEALVEQLAVVLDEGRAALVFSQFTSLLELVARRLSKDDVDFLRLTGDTPPAERVRLVDAFQRGDAKVFLVSLKAGGSGLNLTAADTVFLLDPWWNPAVEDQAADRAHRLGQKRPVTIVRLVAKGTVEEKVLSMHDEKRALVAGVLAGADTAGRLSASELVDLLRTSSADLASDDDDARERDAKGLWRLFVEHASRRYQDKTFRHYDRVCRRLLDGHLRGDAPFASLEARYQELALRTDASPSARALHASSLVAFATAMADAEVVTRDEAATLVELARRLRR